MKKLFKQPLIHFLLTGLGFFLLFKVLSSEEGDSRTIIVDKDALMTHLQYQSKAFNTTVFEEKLAAMPKEELQQMIDNYVREEVLYREAMAMGLDKEDYIIKRRMIQKVEFISEGIAEAVTQLTDEQVEQYYKENMDDYFIQPYATFTHVFFDFEKRDKDNAKVEAEDELNYLNKNTIPFHQATSRGDRFFYHTNYVERDLEYVVSHFGISMAKNIFEATPSDQKWIGPFESQYGFHLVMLTKNQPGKYPDLDEIKERVIDDAQRKYIRLMNEKTIQGIINEYEVRVIYDSGTGDDS